MAQLRTDSLLSRSIVSSFLQFLGTVELVPGGDAEGLEVATQCLSEVFGLNSGPSNTEQPPIIPLIDLFTSVGLGSRGSATPHLPEATQIGQSADHEPLSDPISVGEVEESARDHTSLATDALFELFKEGLELAGTFDGLMNDTPEYNDKVKEAKMILETAVKKVRKMRAAPGGYSEDSLALAEGFKIQGNSAMGTHKYYDAIQLYTCAISLCNNNAIFYANRAAALTQVGKFDEAIEDCEEAIKIDPKYSKAYSRLGFVYFAQDRLQEAIDKGFKKAFELDPSSTFVRVNLQAAQQKLDEQQRSRRQAEPSQTSQNQAGVHGVNPGVGFSTGSFSSGTSFGSGLPINFHLPAEMVNLIPGILNMASEFGHSHEQEARADSGNNASGGNHEPSNEENVNPGSGNGISHEDPGIRLDGGNVNFTFDGQQGQQLPPQFAGLIQSVFQMFGATADQNGTRPGSDNSTPDSNTTSGTNHTPRQH